jgi:hypothetical protein
MMKGTPGVLGHKTALVIVIAAAIGIAACGNPIMKGILAPIREEGKTETGPVSSEPVIYTVSFSAGEGGGGAPADRNAAAGSAITLPGIGAMTAPGGKPALTGWDDGTASYKPGAAYIIPGPVTLVARWDGIANVFDAAIAAAPAGKDGESPENAVPAALCLDLGAMEDIDTAWEQLLEAIKNTEKFVALDLSACALKGGLFDPGTAETGKGKIASLTLPGAAAGIAARDEIPAFQHFAALEEVHGANIGTVGGFAFYGCAALRAVNLPAVTHIGDYAFDYTGGAALTVTLGATPPTVGVGIFNGVAAAKTVTVRVPSAALAAYGAPVSGPDTAECWANGFRGMGWNGSGFAGGGTINQNITVNIAALP